jgi:hypothetical protein
MCGALNLLVSGKTEIIVIREADERTAPSFDIGLKPIDRHEPGMATVEDRLPS